MASIQRIGTDEERAYDNDENVAAMIARFTTSVEAYLVKRKRFDGHAAPKNELQVSLIMLKELSRLTSAVEDIASHLRYRVGFPVSRLDGPS